MLLENLIDIIEQISGKKINSSTMIFDDGIMDSFSLFSELIPKLEEHYCFQIEPMDIMPENFESVEAICELINRKQGLK